MASGGTRITMAIFALFAVSCLAAVVVAIVAGAVTWLVTHSWLNGLIALIVAFLVLAVLGLIMLGRS